MTEYIITDEQAKEAAEHLPLFSVLSWLHKWAVAEESSGYKTITEHVGVNLPEIVRCRDCKHLDDSEYRRWDNSLAECYGEPPLFCDLLSFNEWRMDGDRRVAETTFAEVEPDSFCAWAERRQA